MFRFFLKLVSFLVIYMTVFFNTELQSQPLNPGDPNLNYFRTLGFVVSKELTAINFWLTGPQDQLIYKSFVLANGSEHPWSQRFKAFSLETNHESEIRVQVFAPEIFFSNNSLFPAGGNDGALWQGVGDNLAIRTGFRFQQGSFTLDLRPELVYSQNADFELSPIEPWQLLPEGFNVGPYARPLVRADYVQRFGTKSFHRINSGYSTFQYAQPSWRFGLSTASIQTGPALYNPLILSQNAPGFFHGFVSTNQPLVFSEGLLQMRYFWGQLRSSDYYLELESAHRYVNGISIALQPKHAPGLEIGLNRVAYGVWPKSFNNPAVFFRALQPNPKEPEEGIAPDSDFIAMFSLSARWALPATGFEAYWEWGRNDYRRGLRDLFLEPELNRGFVIGFQKRFDMSTRHWLVFNGEMTQLENNHNSAMQRPRRTWYEDYHIPGGFTHKGQILGAAIGPGSSAQTLALTWYHPYGMLGSSVGRVVHNNDRLFNYRDFYEALQGENIWNTMRRLHEVGIVYGMQMLLFLPYGAEIQFGIEHNSIENRFNVKDLDHTNIRYEVVFRLKRPGWF
jgi:hypothetical protein